jgi:hypothetical protein
MNFLVWSYIKYYKTGRERVEIIILDGRRRQQYSESIIRSKQLLVIYVLHKIHIGAFVI